MSKLSKADLDAFREAVFKDYGIRLEGKILYEAAFGLLEFFKALIKFDSEKSKIREDKLEEVRKSS